MGSGSSRSARFYVGLARGFVHMCLHEKEEGQCGGESQWSLNHVAGHVAGLVGHHLVSY
jgi:hypothetical protein